MHCNFRTDDKAERVLIKQTCIYLNHRKDCHSPLDGKERWNTDQAVQGWAHVPALSDCAARDILISPTSVNTSLAPALRARGFRSAYICFGEGKL